MSKSGLCLFEVNDDGSTGKFITKISDAFKITRHLATVSDDEHSILMTWDAASGAEKQYIISSRELHTNPVDLIGELANQGFYISHTRGMREYFIGYVSQFFDMRLSPIVLLTKRGWNLVSNQWVFAHEAGVIAPDSADEAILRMGGRKLHEQSGTLKDWREQVARRGRQRDVDPAHCSQAAQPRRDCARSLFHEARPDRPR
jgi:hypothetical protein